MKKPLLKQLNNFISKSEMTTSFSAIKTLPTLLPKIFWELEKYIPSQKKIALAISWGSDSMFLAFLILTFWQKQGRDQNLLFFLHCNHKVRKASDNEELFLKTFFKNHNFKSFIRNEEWKHNEASLRSRRYKQFLNFMNENTIDTLLTGHNLTDRIESSLLNMLRGCGINGFLAMQVLEHHDLLDRKQILRPLLNLSKEKIKNLTDELDIPYFNDESNFDNTTSKRNILRNKFLTPLSQFSLQSKDEKAFWNSRKLIYQQLQTQFDTKNDFLQPLKLNPYRWATQGFEWTIPPGLAIEKSLDKILFTLGIQASQGQYQELCKGLQNSSDGNWTIWERQVFLAHQRKYFIKAKPAFREKTLTLEKKITESWIQTFGLFHIEVWSELLWATLRFPKYWDQFHSKNLKKRMLNHQIPIFRRNTLPLAEKDGNIILVWKPEMLIF